MSNQPIALSAAEMKTLAMFADQYRTAQIQAQMAAGFEAQYLALLRAQYGLDDNWHCIDTSVGFVQ